MRVPTTNDRQRTLAQGRAQGLDTGLNVTGYLLGGLIAYGFIGWLIGRAVHAGWLLPAGMLVGLAISTAYVIHRYGRQQPQADTTTPPSPGDNPRTPRKENR
jgi:F0F1-type ATP synthase assembly protein I